MVRVGDIWVDRYEASVWENPDCTGEQYGVVGDDYPASFPDDAQFDEPLFACSTTGVNSSAYLTWFQAQAACTAAGKRLITNAEWQAAVEGTPDPGDSSGIGGACLTNGDGSRAMGEGTTCVSYWGAEDMIGNYFEMVTDWYGHNREGDDGSQPPGEYGEDGYWNVDPAEAQGHSPQRFPAMGNRGGGYGNRTTAGAFAFDLDSSPTRVDRGHGFRCARGF